MVLDSSSSQRYKLQDLRKLASSSPCSSSGDRTMVSHCPRLFLLFMLYVQLHPTDVSPSEAEVLEATRLRIREGDVLGPRLLTLAVVPGCPPTHILQEPRMPVAEQLGFISLHRDTLAEVPISREGQAWVTEESVTPLRSLENGKVGAGFGTRNRQVLGETKP